MMIESERETKSQKGLTFPQVIPQASPFCSLSSCFPTPGHFQLVPSPSHSQNELAMLVPTQKIPDTQESQNELIFTPTQKAPESEDEEDGKGNPDVEEIGGKKRKLSRDKKQCVKCGEILVGCNRKTVCKCCAKCCESFECRAESHKQQKIVRKMQQKENRREKNTGTSFGVQQRKERHFCKNATFK